MTDDVYRLNSSAEREGGTSSPDERAGIFGLETEYVVLYLPDDPSADREPSFSEIEDVLFDILLKERKAALSSGLKGGYFLQNGGLVHMEVFLRDQGDTPILEAATPECRSPWDLLVYSRAFDRLLDRVSRLSAAALADRGWAGRLAFGKNNLDSRDVGFGCHENYLVHHSSTKREKLAYLATLPALVVSLIPAFAVVLIFLIFYCATTALARIVSPARRVAVGLRDLLEGRSRSATLAASYYVVINALLWPTIVVYSQIVRHLAFRPFTRGLTAMVISRQILTGTGRLDFRHRVYETSQRPLLTRSLQTIVMFGRRKTMFDLKGLLFDPLSIFRSNRRLTLTLGDSTLSDVPTLLKLGPTALIIEMLESGVTFDDLRYRSPIRAFAQISREGPWKLIRLRSGEQKNAVEIQREYLARAREFFADRPAGRLRHDEILDLWEDALERLAHRPQGLTDTLDWMAKKQVLDRAVLPQTDWKRFFAWGHVFDVAGLATTAKAVTLRDLERRLPFWKRWKVRRQAAKLALVPDEFTLHRELWFQTRKIDLRYHELSDGDGYQRTLEREGLVRRLTNDEEVDRATFDPPQDTRARVRGYYIALSPSVESVQANWNVVELLSPVRHIALPDPFYCRLPGDG